MVRADDDTKVPTHPPMTHVSISAALRLVLVASALLIAAPAEAQVSIMSPFNLAQAIDQGVKKEADIPYADGDSKRLDIYRPENQTGPAPVVMFIYGGGWAAGEKSEYEFVGRAFAANGYIAVVPNYRKFPEVKYPDFLYDNAQAVKWIEDNIANYGGDKSRFFITGHSAGAYNAVMLAVDGEYLREFGVTMPIKGVAGISGPYNFYPFEYEEVRRTFGAAPNPEGTQPINLVTANTPPMMLISGTSDPIVRVQNTEAFAEKLRASSIWVTEKYYDGFGHMEPVIALGAMWRWRAPVLADTLQFFQTFGAFPSGAPRPAYTPEPPVEGRDPMTALIEQMDDILEPVGGATGG
jgi:acetyl esterase/lipase